MIIKIELNEKGDPNVVLTLGWNEAQAIKKVIRLGLASNDGFIKAEELDVAQKLTRNLDKITKLR